MNVFDSAVPDLYDIPSRAPGPSGSLPFTPEILREWPSGHLFGWTQNAGMGWKAEGLGANEYLVLSTHGGVRAADGTPIALGYHTGHWEVGLLVEEAAREFKANGAIPFAAACTDPCDGGSQFMGTAASSQVVGEALGLSLGHAALAPSGHAIWLDMARRSARALIEMKARGVRMRDILTPASIHNAMVTHAAFGGSTNLI